MNTPPETPTTADVLASVQKRWEPLATRAEYMSVGFGAHHWRISRENAPVLFATLDLPSPTRQASTFEKAYTGAAKLTSQGYRGAVAPLLSTQGAFTAALGAGILSVSPWVAGRTPTVEESRSATHEALLVELLNELHQFPSQLSLPSWQPRLAPDFVVRLTSRLALPWSQGPFGSVAREMALGSIGQIEQMAGRYFALAKLALESRHSWVPTHGEPHYANQMIVDARLVLIDWESLALAPAERDMLDISDRGRGRLGFDPEMLTLFALEWRLAEIDEYTRRFQEPHTGDEDDQLALAKLSREIAGE